MPQWNGATKTTQELGDGITSSGTRTTIENDQIINFNERFTLNPEDDVEITSRTHRNIATPDQESNHFNEAMGTTTSTDEVDANFTSHRTLNKVHFSSGINSHSRDDDTHVTHQEQTSINAQSQNILTHDNSDGENNVDHLHFNTNASDDTFIA